MYLIGMTFEDAKGGKEYKAESSAKTAAEKKCVRVFDADGKVVADYASKKPQSVPHKISDEDLNKLMEQIKDGEVIDVAGKIRRVFSGNLRIRNRPSWEPSAVAGVTNFVDKKVVGILSVSGKPMYKTHDGYFITGDPALVEFTAE